MATVDRTYQIAVSVKLGGMGPYTVAVETQDGEGAKRLAMLLKEHDPGVVLIEASRTTTSRAISVKGRRKAGR